MTMAAIRASTGARWAFFGWSAFMTENFVLSHNREAIIDEAS